MNQIVNADELRAIKLNRANTHVTRSGLFEGLDDESLARLAEGARRVAFPVHGTRISLGSSHSPKFYVIEKGFVSVRIESVLRKWLGRGMPLGEMALFEHDPFGAQIASSGFDLQLIELTYQQVADEFQSSHPFSRAIGGLLIEKMILVDQRAKLMAEASRRGRNASSTGERAKARVLVLLEYLQDAQGISADGFIACPISYGNIASFFGVSENLVEQAVGELQRERKIVQRFCKKSGEGGYIQRYESGYVGVYRLGYTPKSW